jgi:hypothetical protein
VVGGHHTDGLVPGLKDGEYAVSAQDGFAVILAGPKLILRLSPGSAKNKKIPPKTVLRLFTSGKVDEPTTAASENFSFAFTKSNSPVLFKGVGGEHSVTTLSDLITAHKIESIYQHNKFTAGSPPSSLTVRKSFAFLPKDTEDHFAQIFKAVQSSGKAHLLWVVNTKEGKIMPVAVGLATKKQLVLKSGQDEEL